MKLEDELSSSKAFEVYARTEYFGRRGTGAPQLLVLQDRVLCFVDVKDEIPNLLC
jgi:hypothetical protein